MIDLPERSRGLWVPSARRWVCMLPLTMLMAACGSTLAESADDDGAPPPFTGNAESVVIRFDTDAASIRLRPRQRLTVTARIAPAAAHVVRFALLSEPGSPPHDAALSDSEVVSDTQGRAKVELIAPSAPTTSLSLRAQVGSDATAIPLSVLAPTDITLDVRASYSGRRTVTEWVVSVIPERSCESFGAAIPSDSPRAARVAPDEAAIIEDVPAASRFAIAVRAGAYASGCVTLDGNYAGTAPVVVPVSDQPLRLEQTQLDMAFQLEADDPAFLAALDAGLDLVADAFRGDSDDDVDALLNGIHAELAPRQSSSFVTARAAAGWDAALGRSLFAGNTSRLSDAIARWARVGRGALLSPRAFEGRLRGDRVDPESGRLEIDRVGELAANLVDFSVEMTAWNADPADQLVFGGEFSWIQSELVAGLAESPAVAETGATDVPSALAVVAGCAQLGTALSANAAFAATCDVACAESACRGALAAMWRRAASASAEERTRLSVAASGHAVVGDLAQVTSLDGSWVGRLTVNGTERDTRGTAVGFAPKGAAR